MQEMVKKIILGVIMVCALVVTGYGLYTYHSASIAQKNVKSDNYTFTDMGSDASDATPYTFGADFYTEIDDAAVTAANNVNVVNSNINHILHGQSTSVEALNGLYSQQLVQNALETKKIASMYILGGSFIFLYFLWKVLDVFQFSAIKIKSKKVNTKLEEQGQIEQKN